MDQISKMLRLSEKLQNYKRFAEQNLKTLQKEKRSVDQMLQEVSALKRRVESYEKAVKKHYHTLYGKEFGPSSTCNKTVNHQEPQQSAHENLSKDTDNQQRPFPTVSTKTQPRITFCAVKFSATKHGLMFLFFSISVKRPAEEWRIRRIK